MKDLDDFAKGCEEQFGLISGYYIFELHQLSTAAGSNWDYDNPESMEIIVNKGNADSIYAICKEIRSGYSVGVGKSALKKIKEARSQAHKFLFEEANDPSTSIERKIALVKLTSKQ